MELKNLVLLLYTAHEQFTTIQVRWEYSFDTAMTSTITDRWVSENRSTQMTILKSTSDNSIKTIRNHVMRFDRRVWWQKPASWRDESQTETQNNTITLLWKGQWSIFRIENKQSGLRNIEEVKNSHPSELSARIDNVPLLDPSFLLSSHNLEIQGEVSHAGREAIRVKATYRTGKNRIYDAIFWTTADEYELLVDKEHGILLRYAAKISGKEFAVASVDHVVFDEPIPDAIFSSPFDQ